MKINQILAPFNFYEILNLKSYNHEIRIFFLNNLSWCILIISLRK